MSPDRDLDLSGNPCPFLRALAEDGTIGGDGEPLRHLSRVTVETFTNPAPRVPLRTAIWGIGLVGNGLGPRSLLRNLTRGLRAGQLRGGPLDKRGAGSRIIDSHGEVDHSQLQRLREFAVDCIEATSGSREPGLRSQELTAMMDANFARAEGHRRAIDRRLMNGEWPILLRVMGKPGPTGDYLAVAELEALFTERRLPERVTSRIADEPGEP